MKIAFCDPNNPWKILVLANKQTLAQEFLKKIKDFTDQIPEWVWGIGEGESYLDIEAKGHIKTKTTKLTIK